VKRHEIVDDSAAFVNRATEDDPALPLTERIGWVPFVGEAVLTLRSRYRIRRLTRDVGDFEAFLTRPGRVAEQELASTRESRL
jgi:hypothetical protein